MKYVIRYKDGRYYVSKKLLVDSVIFANKFNSEQRARDAVTESDFSPKDCKIEKFDETVSETGE